MANLAVGWLLYNPENPKLPYPISIFTGATSGLLVNFLLNYWFNFSFRERTMLNQFQTFFVIAGIGIILTAVLAKLFLSLLSLASISVITIAGQSISAEFAAHFLAVGLVTFYSFLGHKFFSFNFGLRKGIIAFLNRHNHN